ncbi:helix-turn-helix transcriptional regulator [Sphingobacterium sp. MYb382]|uniref:helix-turn-helix transcriptional regulator n=1 Tax=Sphingobacterium sp. MYb382 TaxID=2745278 RepID=UPI00309F35DD
MNDKELQFRKQLSARIQKLRTYFPLTQPQLGAKIGYKDYQSIGRIENGRVTPSIYLIYQIAEALEVPIEELFIFEER